MTRNEFIDIIDGRTVAIVGNGEPERDYSEEIDSADVVIRFNNFYNYASGKVGSRVDVVFQIFTSAWIRADEKNAKSIQENGARIFCVRKPEQYSPSAVAKFLGPDVCVSDMSDFFRDYNDFTCGGTVLTKLSTMPLNCKIRCYCFPQGDVAEKYFNGPAKHYKNWKQELVEQKRAIDLLERCDIRRPRRNPETVILIPIKESSSGAPGKNDELLPILLEKIKDISIRKVILGKADTLGKSMASRYGIEYFRTGDPTGEVTDDMRLWRDFTEYCGEVVQLQCTSPNFRPEWIGELIDARKHAPIAAVCEEVTFKTNGIYSQSEGVWMQLVPNFGPPSVPRQKLSNSVHLTGGGFAFHSDALSRCSFFQAGVLRPVIVSHSDSIDIDTVEQLENWKRNIDKEV